MPQEIGKLKLKYKIADKLVLSKIRDLVGGRPDRTRRAATMTRP